jgi:photosynthetic reaction center cytochrome c subunit
MIRSRHAALFAVFPLVALGGCELGPKNVQQTGYRGLGLEQITDPDNARAQSLIPPTPYPLPPDEGPRASETYQNVQVLGNLSTERFNHLMASITQWVAPPEQGCNYCHNPENLADDSVYTKGVARRMLQMTQALNGRWSSHTGQTGVTCYTCHRGNAVPEYVWAQQPVPDRLSIRGQRRGQNAPDPNVGYASLPHDVFSSMLGGNEEAVRVASDTAYPGTNRLTTRDAENSYAIMMHLSQSLGVNCTYCHNSQSFRSWSLSSAQRGTAWYGIRMVREINGRYINPLAPVFPANRKGVMGDPYKVNCLTCHQGAAKPLNGTRMLADYPYLRAPGVAQAVATTGPVTRALDQPGAMTTRIDPPNAPASVPVEQQRPLDTTTR